MRYRVIAATLFSIVFLASAPLRAAGAPETGLPTETLLGVSIRSPNAFLAALDGVAVAASKGTLREIPRGAAAMLVRLYNMVPPLALESWDQDKPLFLYATGDLLARPEAAFVFSVKGFDAFLNDVQKRFKRNATLDPDTGAYRMLFHYLGPCLAAPLGENQAVLASNPAMLARLRDAWAEGWRPNHAAEGVLGVEFVPPRVWDPEHIYFEDFPQLIRNMSVVFAFSKDRLAAAGRGGNLARNADGLSVSDHDAVLGFLDALLDVAPEFVHELDNFRGLTLDVDLRDASLYARLVVKTAPDSYLGRVAAAAERRGNRDIAAAGRPADSAIMLGFAPSVADLLPGAAETLPRLAGIAAKQGLQGMSGESAAVCRDLIANTGGESVFSWQITDSGWQFVHTARAADPAKALAAWLSFVDLSNAFSDKSAQNGGQITVKYGVEERGAEDGRAYTRVKFTPESVKKAIEATGMPVAAARQVLQPFFDSFAALLRPGDASLSVAMGSDGEDAMLGALARAESVFSGGIADAAVRDAAASVVASQNLLTLYRLDRIADPLLLDFARRGIDMGDATYAPVEPIFKFMQIPASFAEARPEFRRSAAWTAFSLGVAGGRLTAELAVPLDALNAAYGNWQLFKANLRKALDAKAAEANAAAGDSIDLDDIAVFGDDGGFGE